MVNAIHLSACPWHQSSRLHPSANTELNDEKQVIPHANTRLLSRPGDGEVTILLIMFSLSGWETLDAAFF